MGCGTVVWCVLVVEEWPFCVAPPPPLPCRPPPASPADLLWCTLAIAVAVCFSRACVQQRVYIRRMCCMRP